ncbi:MAG: 4-amino-4-deoxy-L-arabinose transferase [Isosphaeraceae bacterium]|nr:4-amino-4-deoxy-L-arabinose transferase [Isosphaeraceae bacterium]
MILDILFTALLTIAGLTLGRWITVALGERLASTEDRLAIDLPLGLGAIALISVGLGQIGALRTEVSVIGVGVLAAIGSIRMIPHVGRPRIRELVDSLGGDPLWNALLGAGLLGSFLTALLPVTDGDALCYHLQVPKLFLASGSLSFDPDLHETVYPLVVEMLYAHALAWRGPVACRLVEWLLGVVFAAGAASLARPWLGGRAWRASTIAVLVPAVSNGMGAPLNDVALAAYCTSALAAALRWEGEPSPRRATLAGMLMGLAIGVKFPALVFVGLLGLVGLRRSLEPKRFRDLATAGLVAFVVGGAWYVRSYVHTGNPVHPFFRSFFGGAGLDEVLDPIKRPLDPTPLNLLGALWPMTLDPARFDSFSHQFGPIFLATLPLLLVFRAPKGLWALTGFGYAFLTICLTQRQSMRFVLAALGPFSVAAAWVVSSWWDRRDRSTVIAKAIVVVLLSFQAALALARPRAGLDLFLGRESSSSFLSRREPTYRVGLWVDENLPEDARLIGQDHRGFYFPRPYTMELAHRRRTGLGAAGESAEAIVAALRDRGFTHLILCPPVPETAVEFDPTLSRRLETWTREHPPVFRADLSDADGVVRRYAIHELSASTGTASSDSRRVR